MIFVFGGAYAGKGDYVKNSLGITQITEHDADYETLKNAKAIRDIHLYIKAVMLKGGNPHEEIKRLLADNPGVILISNEIGYGIVPADKFERDWREAAGRISCYLADKAEKVIRVVCGIGVVIK